jgi:hypothetical protein
LPDEHRQTAKKLMIEKLIFFPVSKYFAASPMHCQPAVASIHRVELKNDDKLFYKNPKMPTILDSRMTEIA